jgi:uncharacterized RDD family membrane protein YckC
MSDPTQRPPGEQPPPSAPPPGAPPPGGSYPQQQQYGGYPAQPAGGPGGPSGPRAGFGGRLGAYLLDALIIGVPAAILFVILGGAASRATDEAEQAAFGGGFILLWLIFMIASILYYVLLNGGPTGQTIGKRVLGIRVVSYQTGGPIGYGKAFVRWLVGPLFSGFCIIGLLGYLWMLWDNEKQTWHDKASDSVVVPVSAYPIQR